MVQWLNTSCCAPALLTSAFLVGVGCAGAETLPVSSVTNVPPPEVSSLVRSINLPHFEPALPVAAGRGAFMVVCVSCHSSRYVTMQPLFPQRQWEETVEKMAKVYGAPMTLEQKQAIVGYLVAIHGPDSLAKAPVSGADDFGTALTAKLVTRPELAPLLKPAAGATEHAAEVSRGADLFQQDCAGCHGAAGKGDGWVGPALLRKPKNLAATRFSIRLLSQVLWNGKPGTAMPAWRSLPLSDLTALAAYVQSFHQPDQAGQPSPRTLQQGSAVFLQNCAPCHGPSGDGKGPAAANLIPEPANFTLNQPDFDYILQVLRDGIPGTAMPAWKNQIPEADRRAVAEFVRSCFKPDDAPEK